MKMNLLKRHTFAGGMACAVALFAFLFGNTSCSFVESSDNGDFDGFWHLERIDTLATNGVLDLSQLRVFWGVQYKLVSCRNTSADNFRGYYFRFRQTGDSIILYEPYKNNWHQDKGEDGGDIPVTEMTDDVRSLGINNLEEPYLKEKLKGDKMILRSKTLRLYFKKF